MNDRDKVFEWFRKAIRSDLLGYYKFWKNFTPCKKLAYMMAKDSLCRDLNNEAKRNFEGQKNAE